ncbi:Adiponectin receptor protein 1 [Chytriomyces hyalinus]|nr:Adiponectin receptor protein 1 [Chytriomyces hyalinus]
MSTVTKRVTRSQTRATAQPDLNASNETAKRKHSNKHGLLSIKQIPAWMYDNEFILSGYRPEMGNYADCFRSLLYVHNETGSIYTHLIGCLIHVVAVVYVLWFAVDNVGAFAAMIGDNEAVVKANGSVFGWADVAVAACLLLSAVVCMGLSAAFHTFHCHSHPVSKAWNKLDFAGIAALIAGSNIPFIYYGFYCEPSYQTLYIAFMLLFGAVTTLVTVSERYSTPKYRMLRTSLFVAMGLSSIIPIIHLLLEHGYNYASVTMSINHGIAGGICYLVGAFLYASRIPERLMPAGMYAFSTIDLHPLAIKHLVFPENPSEVIAKQVSAKIQTPSSKLSTIFNSVVDRTIAVSHKGLDAFYEEGILNDPEVTHIVHVGVAAGVKKLHLETIAFNVKAESAVVAQSTEEQEFTDDKQNEQVTVAPIDASEDALLLLPSTFDLNHPRFHRFVQKNSSCVTWSRDAGTYFCNEIYYRTLLNVTKEDEVGDVFKKVIFVHVPLPEVLSEEQCAELIVQFLEVDAGI